MPRGRMYLAILHLHSWLRWVVLLSAAAALWGALTTLRHGSAATRLGKVSAKVFTGTLDLQILLGLLLYFLLSPYTPNSFAAFGASMKVTVLRYFSVEHPFLMLIAAAVAHIGAVRARKAPNERVAQRRLAIAIGVALLLILAGIPWPFLPAGRPLFRLS